MVRNSLSRKLSEGCTCLEFFFSIELLVTSDPTYAARETKKTTRGSHSNVQPLGFQKNHATVEIMPSSDRYLATCILIVLVSGEK